MLHVQSDKKSAKSRGTSDCWDPEQKGIISSLRDTQMEAWTWDKLWGFKYWTLFFFRIMAERKGAWSLSAAQWWLTGSLSWKETSLLKKIYIRWRGCCMTAGKTAVNTWAHSAYWDNVQHMTDGTSCSINTRSGTWVWKQLSKWWQSPVLNSQSINKQLKQPLILSKNS